MYIFNMRKRTYGHVRSLNLCCPHEIPLRPWLSKMRPVNFLARMLLWDAPMKIKKKKKKKKKKKTCLRAYASKKGPDQPAYPLQKV